jgi:hypothetical protein
MECRRRVAAWRSIRAPRVLRRIGPTVRSPVAWSRERLTAGGSGGEDGLAAFAEDAEDAVAVFFAEVGDVQAGGFEDPQSEEPEQADQREVVPVRR